MAKTLRYAEGDALDYTPGADVAAGEPQQIGDMVGIPMVDIDNGDQGAVAITGHFQGLKVTGAMSKGTVLGWDADADPNTGDAGTGAYTDDHDAWDYPVGLILKDADSGDNYVIFSVNEYSLSVSGIEQCVGADITGANDSDYQDYLFCAHHDLKVEQVVIYADADGGSSDDSSNNYEFQVQNLTDAEALISSPLNTGDDSVLNTADTAYTLGVDQNQLLDTGDILELQVTASGTPNVDHSGITIRAEVRYHLLES